QDIYQPNIYTSITQKQEYVRGFDIAKSGLKFALESGLVDEFVGLIIGFIENHTGVNTNQRILVDITQIENLKKLKHKGCSKKSSSTQEILQDLNIENAETSRPTKQANIETNNNNVKLKSG
ncbi:17511_t:CDS:1, partial [Cetraspora pellucida]